MIAWKVADIHNEAWLLIFANTRNRARYLAFTAGLWEYEYYLDIKATRAFEYDNIFDGEKVVEDNSDLPEGSLKFYSEEVI